MFGILGLQPCNLSGKGLTLGSHIGHIVVNVNFSKHKMRLITKRLLELTEICDASILEMAALSRGCLNVGKRL